MTEEEKRIVQACRDELAAVCNGASARGVPAPVLMAVALAFFAETIHVCAKAGHAEALAKDACGEVLRQVACGGPAQGSC